MICCPRQPATVGRSEHLHTVAEFDVEKAWWGNREETSFELPAGAVTPLAPVLESISGYAACQIDAATGRTIVHQRPFGGGISIAGFIPGAPDRSSPPMKYRLVARQIGSGGAVVATETLSTGFGVWVTETK